MSDVHWAVGDGITCTLKIKRPNQLNVPSTSSSITKIQHFRWISKISFHNYDRLCIYIGKPFQNMPVKTATLNKPTDRFTWSVRWWGNFCRHLMNWISLCVTIFPRPSPCPEGTKPGVWRWYCVVYILQWILFSINTT